MIQLFRRIHVQPVHFQAANEGVKKKGQKRVGKKVES